MITASLPWYYQNIYVEPLWDHGIQLAYRLVLPGMSSENYLSYDIRYFSVPIGGDHLRRVMGAPAVAVNTAAGHSFIPNPDQCLGNSPMVCHPSHIHLQDTCETRLVSGFGDPLCKIQITSRENKTLELYRQNSESSEIVLVGYCKITVIKRCLGQPASHMYVIGPMLFFCLIVVWKPLYDA